MAASKKSTKKDTGSKVRSAAKRSSTPTVRSKNEDGKKPAQKAKAKPAIKKPPKSNKSVKSDNVTKASTRIMCSNSDLI
jgi:hypothetical protein